MWTEETSWGVEMPLPQKRGRPQLRWEYCVKMGVKGSRGKVRGGERMLQCEKKQWCSSSVQDANVTIVQGNHDKEQRFVYIWLTETIYVDGRQYQRTKPKSYYSLTRSMSRRYCVICEKSSSERKLRQGCKRLRRIRRTHHITRSPTHVLWIMSVPVVWQDFHLENTFAFRWE